VSAPPFRRADPDETEMRGLLRDDPSGQIVPLEYQHAVDTHANMNRFTERGVSTSGIRLERSTVRPILPVRVCFFGRSASRGLAEHQDVCQHLERLNGTWRLGLGKVGMEPLLKLQNLPEVVRHARSALAWGRKHLVSACCGQEATKLEDMDTRG
jgi:hypothetical protein